MYCLSRVGRNAPRGIGSFQTMNEELWEEIARLNRKISALQERVWELEQRMDDVETEIILSSDGPLLLDGEIMARPVQEP